MATVSHIHATRLSTALELPAPRYTFPEDKFGFVELDPEVYPWAEEGGFALIKLGKMANGHLHAIDLGEGALLAYLTTLEGGKISLKFVCAFFDAAIYPKNKVKVVGRVMYIQVSQFASWSVDDKVLDEISGRVYERPVLKRMLG